MNDELMQNLLAIKADKDTNLLPENLKKGITCLGIDGTLEASSGDVKLFETEEEMQADTTAKDGDLAVVYRNEIQNMTAETETQYITFPESVTLPEAFTGSVFTMLRAVDESTMFDGQIMLEQNNFRFDGFTGTGRIRVSYSSSDGVTYTRDEFMGDNGDLTNPVDLGTIVHCEMVEEWNDVLGYFMQIGGNIFDGLFEYKALTKLDNCITLTDVLDNILYVLPATNPEEYADKKDFLHILYLIKSVKLRGTIKNVSVYEPMDYCILYNANAISGNTGDNVHTLLQDNNGCYVGGDEYKELDSTHNNEIGLVIEKYVNSALSDKSVFTKKELFDKRIKIGINNTNWSYCKYEFDILQDYDLTAVGSYSLSRTYNSDVFEFGTNNSSKTSKCVYDGVFNAEVTPKMTNIETATEIVNYASYVIAPNQYTLVSSNQLLPNIIAYGKNGNVIGDKSIYDNLDWENIMVSYNLLSDDAGRIIPYDNLTQTIISYDTNVSGYSKNCKTRGVKYTKSNFVTIDEDVTSTIVGTSSIRINKNELYYFAGRKKTVDNDTIYTIEITRYKVENGKLHISLYDSQNIENGTFAYITSISGSSLTLGDYAIKYNPNDNCIYYVFLDDSKYANFVKYDIENKNFTKLFKTSIAYTYGKWNIDFNNQMVYVDSSTSKSFDSYTFSGTKKTIQSHKGYSSSLCCSDIYIGVKNGSNSNAILYNMLTKSFTSIIIPTQSGWVLYTYDNITYVIYRDEDGVYKYMIIKNDSVISTSDVDNTYNIGTSVPNTIIPSSGRFYGNAANLIFDDKLLMLPYSIIDVQNNIVYAIQNMPYTILLYLYMDTEKFNWVYANEQYISYRQSINCYSDGNGKYLAILLYGSDYTPCKAQDTYLDTHYVLNDYEDTISPDEYNTALNTAKQIEGGVE